MYFISGLIKTKSVLMLMQAYSRHPVRNRFLIVKQGLYSDGAHEKL